MFGTLLQHNVQRQRQVQWRLKSDCCGDRRAGRGARLPGLNGFNEQVSGVIWQVQILHSELWDYCATPFGAAGRGRYETRSGPMQCECLVDRPNQDLVRCPNKATQRLTISHLKVYLLICEDYSTRQLAWAEHYRSLPGSVVVESVQWALVWLRWFDSRCCATLRLATGLAGFGGGTSN